MAQYVRDETSSTLDFLLSFLLSKATPQITYFHHQDDNNERQVYKETPSISTKIENRYSPLQFWDIHSKQKNNKKQIPPPYPG